MFKKYLERIGEKWEVKYIKYLLLIALLILIVFSLKYYFSDISGWKIFSLENILTFLIGIPIAIFGVLPLLKKGEDKAEKILEILKGLWKEKLQAETDKQTTNEKGKIEMLTKLETKLKDGEENLYSQYISIKNKTTKIFETVILPSNFFGDKKLYNGDYGTGHTERILEYLDKIIIPINELENNLDDKSGLQLTLDEIFCLISGAWLHNVGLFVTKKGEKLSDVMENHDVIGEKKSLSVGNLRKKQVK